MSFSSLLRSFVPKRVARNKIPAAPRCRPALEILEDRSVPSSLSGYVSTSNTYQPLGNATVELTSANHVIMETHTNAHGAYSFTNLPEGTYTLVVIPYIGGNHFLVQAQPGTVNGQPDGVSGGEVIESIQLNGTDSGVNYDFWLLLDNT